MYSLVLGSHGMGVLQEVAMASEKRIGFFCGDRVLTFETIPAVLDIYASDLSCITTDPEFFASTLKHFKLLREGVVNGQPLPAKLNLSLMLAITAQRKATDPKDKIFGLYGIAKYLGWPLWEPDYEKPLSQIYTEATRCAIEQDRSLILLNELAYTPRIQCMPSWVPNFAEMPITTFLRWSMFKAAGNSSLTFSFSADGSQLSLGVFVDSIQSCCNAVSNLWENTASNDSALTRDMFVDALPPCENGFMLFGDNWLRIREVKHSCRSSPEHSGETVLRN